MPLSESTLDRRRRAGISGDAPLVATGRGMRAATRQARWRILSDRAEYRADSFPETARYMPFHQTGFYNEQTDSSVPARPFAILDKSDENEIADEFVLWVRELIDEEWERG